MRNWTGKYGSDWLHALAHRLSTSENAILMVLAALLGFSTALCIWLFQEAIDLIHASASQLQAAVSPVFGAVSIVMILALVGAAVGWIMARFVGEERHHGVAGILESVAYTGGRLPYRRMPFKAIASALSLGGGASVGPEDPSVQIGANLGSWIGTALHVKEDQMRLLVAAGAAAAIAAAFRAPIAGVFFALEVILNGAFETHSFGVIVLASVMSSALIQAIHSTPEMGPFNYALGTPLEIPLFVPLGAVLALVSVLFVRILYSQQGIWLRLAAVPHPVRTALAGALVGIVGIVLPQIMGSGRETMNAVLSGEAHFSVLLLVALGIFKILMTAVSMAGGFAGGIFAPTLFVGTVIGNLYGQVITSIFRDPRLGDPQAYAIVGMAATMAGVVRSPITAIMMVFELTNDYRLILPMMLTTVVCVVLAERIEKHGIYVHSLLRHGIQLPQGREIDLMQGVGVAEAMLTPAPTIAESATVNELRATFQRLRSNSVCVLNEEGALSGVVTLSDLQNAVAKTLDTEQRVGDICSRQVITIYPEQRVWEAIRILIEHDIGRIPVVRRGTREVVGLIGRHGIVRAYNLAATRRLQDQHAAEQIRLNTFTRGHVVEHVIRAGSVLAGCKIRDIDWPSESAVVAIWRHGQLIVPHGDTDLLVGDSVAMLADQPQAADLAALFAASESAE